MTEDQYLLANKIQEATEHLNALILEGSSTGIEAALTVEHSMSSFGSQPKSHISLTFKFYPYTKPNKPSFE